MVAKPDNIRDNAFSLILGPSEGRSPRGFCLFIYPITFLTIDKKKPLKHHAPSVFFGVKSYGFFETI